jgi:hypothetical protein
MERITKGTIGGWRPGGGGVRLFDDPIRVIFYHEEANVDKFANLARQAQEFVEIANGRLPTRDHDNTLTVGEVMRAAVLEFYEEHRTDHPYVLAKKLRPYLGMSKPLREPGAHPRKVFENRKHAAFVVERSDKEKFRVWADEVNVVIDEENALVSGADGDDHITPAELYRLAIDLYVERFGDAPLDVAKKFRPKIGQSKRVKHNPDFVG